MAPVLRRLQIENLVLIREAELDLSPGLNAITGETGAGKTILAQAVGLLLGTKGDDSFVGPAGAEAYVEAEIDLPDELDELVDLRPEDEDALLVSRRVFADGRTRAYAWGRASAREDVAAAVERVVAMSGQFEQRRLAKPSYQLEVLDRFCGEEQLARRAAARTAWRELQPARRRHDELTANAALAEARLAELRALVEDTDGMEPGEEDRLRTERERHRHVAELAAAAAAAPFPCPGVGGAARPAGGGAHRARRPRGRLRPRRGRRAGARRGRDACANARTRAAGGTERSGARIRRCRGRRAPRRGDGRGRVRLRSAGARRPGVDGHRRGRLPRPPECGPPVRARRGDRLGRRA